MYTVYIKQYDPCERRLSRFIDEADKHIVNPDDTDKHIANPIDNRRALIVY